MEQSTLDKLKDLNTKEHAPELEPTPTPAPTPKKIPEAKFQHYGCSLQSVTLATTSGKAVVFIGFKLITKDKEIIEYLDAEISNGGIKGFTKGALMTAEEANPMNSLKAAIIKEYEEKKRAEAVALALGEKPDMGETEQTRINPASSATVATNASGSASGIPG